VSPLSFAFRNGAQVVEVGHDVDTALVAPFGGVACTHTHGSGIVCCIPRLRCRLPKQPLYARGLSRAEAYGPTLRPKRAIMYQLGLKERRDASSATPFRASLRHARRLWGLNTAPCTIVSYCQISRCHKILLRLSQVPQRLWQAGLTTYLVLTCTTLTCRMSCTHLRSLNQTSKSPLSSLSPLGSLREPCQHTCLKHLYRNLWIASVAKILAVRVPRAQGDAGVLSTISNKEPFSSRFPL